MTEDQEERDFQTLQELIKDMASRTLNDSRGGYVVPEDHLDTMALNVAHYIMEEGWQRVEAKAETAG